VLDLLSCIIFSISVFPFGKITSYILKGSSIFTVYDTVVLFLIVLKDDVIFL
jgi:hypothetical protein